MDWDPLGLRHIPHNNNIDLGLNRLPQNFELSRKLPECLGRLGTAITCLLIMITIYNAHLCFSSIIKDSFYVLVEIPYILINISIVIIVIAICCRCVFGSYFGIDIILTIAGIIAAIIIMTVLFGPIVLTLLIVC